VSTRHYFDTRGTCPVHRVIGIVHVPTSGSSGPVFRNATMSLISLFVPFIFQLPPTKNLRPIFLVCASRDRWYLHDVRSATEQSYFRRIELDPPTCSKLEPICSDLLWPLRARVTFLPPKTPDSTTPYPPPSSIKYVMFEGLISPFYLVQVAN